MRNPNRLYNFYDEVKRLHMTYFPDCRTGQLWVNFLNWIADSGVDPFFPEEDELLTYLKKFCGEE